MLWAFLVAARHMATVVQCLGFSTVVAPVAAEHSSRALARYSGCKGLVAPQMWCLPRPGVKPESPALAAGLLITEPPVLQHQVPGALLQIFSASSWMSCMFCFWRRRDLPRSHVTWSVTACCGCGLLGHETGLLKNSSQILLGFSNCPCLCSSPDFPLRASSYAAGFHYYLREGVTVSFYLDLYEKLSPKGWYF